MTGKSGPGSWSHGGFGSHGRLEDYMSNAQLTRTWVDLLPLHLLQPRDNIRLRGLSPQILQGLHIRLPLFHLLRPPHHSPISLTQETKGSSSTPASATQNPPWSKAKPYHPLSAIFHHSHQTCPCPPNLATSHSSGTAVTAGT